MALDGNYVTGVPTANAPGAFPDFIKYFTNTTPLGTPQSLGSYPVGVVEQDQSVTISATHTASFDLLSGSNADFSTSVGANGSPVALTIQAEDGNHRVLLNRGPDSFQAATQNTNNAPIGTDSVVSSGGHDTMTGGYNHDLFVGGGQSNLVGGTAGDTLVGGLFASSHDTITAGTGGDIISVARGSNTIYGNTNDTIHAGFSQSSHDTIVGGVGPETIYGGRNTEIYGGGHDSIVAGINDEINLYGHDTLMGGGANTSNTVYTAAGSHASIQGGQGQLDVTLATGRHGNDSIFGGSGEVTVNIDKSASDIVKDKTVGDVRNITFAGGQQIHVSNVTLDFTKDHPNS